VKKRKWEKGKKGGTPFFPGNPITQVDAIRAPSTWPQDLKAHPQFMDNHIGNHPIKYPKTNASLLKNWAKKSKLEYKRNITNITEWASLVRLDLLAAFDFLDLHWSDLTYLLPLT